MDVLHSIWISSVTGAGLFLSAGLAARRRPQLEDGGALARAEQRIAALAGASEQAVTELAGERARRAAAEAKLEERARRSAFDQVEHARLGVLVDRLQSEAIQLRAAADQRSIPEEVGHLRGKLAEAARDLQAERAAGRQRHAEVEAELALARRREAELAAEQATAKRLEAELAGARAAALVAEKRVRPVEARLEESRTGISRLAADVEAAKGARVAAEAALAAAREKLDALGIELSMVRASLMNAEVRAADAGRLREENAALRVEVVALGEERGARRELADAQRLNAELSLRCRTLEQRALDLGQRAAENEALRQRVAALEGVAAEIEILRARSRDLEAQGFARRAAEPAPPPSRGARTSEMRLEEVLERRLEQLRAVEIGCRAAVLTDTSGLLIAASGEGDHRDELGAVTTIASGAAERMRELLPFGMPRSIAIVDENRVMFHARWMRQGADTFLLGTLGVAPEEAVVEGEIERALLVALAESA